MTDQKNVCTSIGIMLSFGPLYEQVKGLIYPYKLLANLTDDKMELVESGTEKIFCSFLLVNNADKKMYGAL